MLKLSSPTLGLFGLKSPTVLDDGIPNIKTIVNHIRLRPWHIVVREDRIIDHFQQTLVAIGLSDKPRVVGHSHGKPAVRRETKRDIDRIR